MNIHTMMHMDGEIRGQLLPHRIERIGYNGFHGLNGTGSEVSSGASVNPWNPCRHVRGIPFCLNPWESVVTIR